MARCYDGSWPFGSHARGTRAQFRLNNEYLHPFRSTFPLHLSDAMDAIPLAQSPDFRGGELSSPLRGTRTRAVREFEQTIEELKKENFDLKLRIYLLEQAAEKNSRGRSSTNDDVDNTVQVIVELKTETEILKNELGNKNQLLQDALDNGEKYAADLADLQDKFEIAMKELTEENQRLSQEISTIRQHFERQIQKYNQEKEELESKYQKSKLAIKGLAEKCYTYVEMVPKVLRPIVQSAVKAAKENKTEDVNVALGNFKTALSQISTKELQRSSEVSSSESMRVNRSLFRCVNNSREQTSPNTNRKLSAESLNDEVKVRKSESSEDFEQIMQLFKSSEILNTDKEEMSKENVDLKAMCKVLEEDRGYLENELVNATAKIQNLEKMVHEMEEEGKVLGENRTSNAIEDRENLALLSSLRKSCEDLESKKILLQNELFSANSKIVQLEAAIAVEKSISSKPLPRQDAFGQTALEWHSMQSKLSEKFLQSVGDSNDVDRLKEEILTLLLLVGQKDKEMSELEERLAPVGDHVGQNANSVENLATTGDEAYVIEKSELHRRLAHSCSLNHDLMNNLRDLEKFLEDLLQHTRLDESSWENISEISEFISHFKSCLDDTVELSTVLNDQLSICETSKIFDLSNASLLGRPSLLPSDTAQSKVNSSQLQGRHNFSQLANKVVGTGKRRLSFSTLHSSTKSAAPIDTENVVFLGTSNNEDLLLLLNDNGDPQDVLIRNSISTERHPRRCWETSSSNVVQGEKSAMETAINRWYTSSLTNSKTIGTWHNPCPSSDSDIWSEPDRDVSLQRIGIDVQKSPVAQRSPRRSRLRDRRTTDEVGSHRNESPPRSSKIHAWSKRRKSIDITRTSFICKKCMSYSQTPDDEVGGEKQDLVQKCSRQENELGEKKRLLKESETKIASLNEEKLELSNCVNHLKEELSNLRASKGALALRCSESDSHVTSLNSENNILNDRLNELESNIESYDSMFEQLKKELDETKSELQDLDQKCMDYEEQILSDAEIKQNLSCKLEALNEEKMRLEKDVDTLTACRNQLMSNIEAEKEIKQRAEIENQEITEELQQATENISTLQNRNTEIERLYRQMEEESSTRIDEITEELRQANESILTLQKKRDNFEGLCRELSEENEECKGELLSSNTMCNALQADLQNIRETLVKMESKCSSYEEKLNESSESKHRIFNFLSDAKDKFSSTLDTVMKINDHYLDADRRKDLADRHSAGDTSGLDMDDQIGRIIEDLVQMSSTFETVTSFLAESVHSLQYQIEQSNEEKYTNSIISLKKKLEESEQELALLKVEYNRLNRYAEELQQKAFDMKSWNESQESNIRLLKNQLKADEDKLEHLREYCKMCEEQAASNCRAKRSFVDLLADIKSRFSSGLRAMGEEFPGDGRFDPSNGGDEDGQIAESVQDINQMCEKLERFAEIYSSRMRSRPERNESTESMVFCSSAKQKLDKNELHTLRMQNEHLRRYMEDQLQEKLKDQVLKKINLGNKPVKEIVVQVSTEDELYPQSLQTKKNINSSLSDIIDKFSIVMYGIAEGSKPYLDSEKLKAALHETSLKNTSELDENHQIKTSMDDIGVMVECFNRLAKFLLDHIHFLHLQLEQLKSDGSGESLQLSKNLNVSKSPSLLNVSDRPKIPSLERKSEENSRVCTSEPNIRTSEKNSGRFTDELDFNSEMNQNIPNFLMDIRQNMFANFNILFSLCKEHLSPQKKQVLFTMDQVIEADFTQGKDVVEISKDILYIKSQTEKVIGLLSEDLRCLHLRQQQTDNRRESKVLEKQLRAAEDEVRMLTQRNEQWQALTEQYQQTLRENDQKTAAVNTRDSDTEEAIANLRSEVEMCQKVVNAKDDEILQLQERIFNLQTYVNNLSFKKTRDTESPTLLGSPGGHQSGSMQLSSHDQQDNEAKDDSFTSESSSNPETPKKIDHYMKKVRALQARLSMTEKRNEMLEKEKSDLREELLAQLNTDKRLRRSAEDIHLQKEMTDLKANLETKTSFIKELKGELFKTCNSLVDKQKEVDELQKKFSESKKANQPQLVDADELKFRYSDPIQVSVENSIKELKKHKGELIQGILKHQKQFYELKNIHLGHFEKFKNHIEKLRSLQMAPPLSKAESDPLLNHPTTTGSTYAQKCDRTLKNMQIELELDVEFLHNLKIFLKRFLIPLVLQSGGCDKLNAKKESELDKKAAPVGQRDNSSLVPDNINHRRAHLKLDFGKLTSSLLGTQNPLALSPDDVLISATALVSREIDCIEIALKNAKSALEHFNEISGQVEETSKKSAAKFLLTKLLPEISTLSNTSFEIFRLNSDLKALGLFEMSIFRNPNKTDASDRESLLSEETIALSRSESLSPTSFDEHLFGGAPSKEQGAFRKSDLLSPGATRASHAAGGSQDSVFQRSHFSSPDLGIESDANHESSAPEQAEKDDVLRNGLKTSKMLESGSKSRQWSGEKRVSASVVDRSMYGDESSSKIGENTLHAIGYLQEYELLRKEVQESLVGIKTVMSRTGDGLQHVSKYTSPRKNLEYSTFKSIKDICSNVEVCLQEANRLVDNFWIAPCPSVKEMNKLILRNQEQQQKLRILHESKHKQELHFNEVVEKLKQAESLKETMEKKISRKLVKTKKIIRRAEMKMLEKESKELQSIPKYPNQASSCQKKL